MKTFLFLTVMFIVMAINTHAQTGPDTTLVISFEKTVNDYGNIVQGSEGTCEFMFTNMGKTPLILNNVVASCGCTVPSWTREPVAPGTQGSIKVKYNTNNVGPFTKSITVTSNAKNSPVVLTIKGTVTAKPQ
jgi:hypothetical protein